MAVSSLGLSHWLAALQDEAMHLSRTEMTPVVPHRCPTIAPTFILSPNLHRFTTSSDVIS